MKFGYRKPSLAKSVKARTTGRATRAVKSMGNPYYGKKGSGLINDPKKVTHNKVYHKTTTSAFNTTDTKSSASNSSENDEHPEFSEEFKQTFLNNTTEHGENTWDKIYRHLATIGYSILFLGQLLVVLFWLLVLALIIYILYVLLS